MTSEAYVNARVAAAAALLDRREPGWERMIMPAVLNMQHNTKCVLGQVYGDYWSPSATAIRMEAQDGFDGAEVVEAFGTESPNKTCRAWLREVEKRLDAPIKPSIAVRSLIWHLMQLDLDANVTVSDLERMILQ